MFNILNPRSVSSPEGTKFLLKSLIILFSNQPTTQLISTSSSEVPLVTLPLPPSSVNKNGTPYLDPKNPLHLSGHVSISSIPTPSFPLNNRHPHSNNVSSSDLIHPVIKERSERHSSPMPSFGCPPTPRHAAQILRAR